TASINPLAEALPFAVGACSAPMFALPCPRQPRAWTINATPMRRFHRAGNTDSVRRHRLAKRFQRLGADMMLDALGIDTRRLGADAERTQKRLDRLMALAAFMRDLAAGFGQKHAAIGFSGNQPIG